MSMKPGATMSPRASIVRAASPERSRATAAMRSPSIATSAAAAGAPLPSTTVPCLISSDHMGLTRRGPRRPPRSLPQDRVRRRSRRSERNAPSRGGLDDLHGLHLVALADLVHDVHPGGHLAEDGVLAVEEMSGRERDVELAAGG